MSSKQKLSSISDMTCHLQYETET